MITGSINPKDVFMLIGECFFNLLGMRKHRKENDLLHVKRVLVVRLDEIGDVVMTTPFLRELRQNLPETWITLIVKPEVYNFVELCPYVNEVLTYDWKVKGRFKMLKRHIRAIKLALLHLWKQRFDLAIVPRWDADYYHASFVAYFSGAPLRVGYSENVNNHKKQFNSGFDRLFTHVINNNMPMHEVERNLEVIRYLGGKVQEERLELWLGSEDLIYAQQVLKSAGVGENELLIAFGPGARAAKRIWPISRFISLGVWLKKEYNARIIVMGGRGEEDLGRELRKQLGHTVIDTVGKTTIRQAGALLKHCKLFVGNDAGPMHLAAAAGVPIIEISCHPENGLLLHPNSPYRFRPWRVPHIVLQPKNTTSPCKEGCEAEQAHCILGITVEQVSDAIEKLNRGQTFKF